MQSSRWLVIDNAEVYHAHNEGLASSTLFGSDASQFSTGATLTQVDLGGVASKGVGTRGRGVEGRGPCACPRPCLLLYSEKSESIVEGRGPCACPRPSPLDRGSSLQCGLLHI